MLTRQLSFESQKAEAVKVLNDRIGECNRSKGQLNGLRNNKMFKVGRSIVHLIISLLVFLLFASLAANIVMLNIQGGDARYWAITGGFVGYLGFHLYTFIPGLVGEYGIIDAAFSWTVCAMFLSIAIYAFFVFARSIERIIKGSRLNAYSFGINHLSDSILRIQQTVDERVAKIQKKYSSIHIASDTDNSVERKIEWYQKRIKSFSPHTFFNRAVQFFFVVSPAIFCIGASALLIMIYYATSEFETSTRLPIYIAIGLNIAASIGTYIWRFVKTMANDDGEYTAGSFASLMLSALFVPFFSLYYLLIIPGSWTLFESGSIGYGIGSILLLTGIFYGLWRLLNHFRIWTKDA